MASHYPIPVILQAAGALAAFAHPGHLTDVSSRGFTQLPPSCSSNYLGYMRPKYGAFDDYCRINRINGARIILSSQLNIPLQLATACQNITLSDFFRCQCHGAGGGVVAVQNAGFTRATNTRATSGHYRYFVLLQSK